MKPSEKICRLCGLSRPVAEEFCPSCTAPSTPPAARKKSIFSAVNTYLETRWGGGPENPTSEEMAQALAELDVHDAEHPNTWLSDEDDWTVDVYESGLVIFNHQNEKICERRGVDRRGALELWLLLQQRRRDEIRQRLSA